jgi:hypothetical protein
VGLKCTVRCRGRRANFVFVWVQAFSVTIGKLVANGGWGPTQFSEVSQ